MPSSRNPTTTTALARHKALTPVHVSGLTGVHTLETGLAYYYRGHYLYAAPAGILIEPIPFSTRKGIAIRGVLHSEAPVYDAGAQGLRAEAETRALEVSVREAMRKLAGSVVGGCGVEGGDEEHDAGSEALEATECAASIVRRVALPAEELHGSVASLAALRESGRKGFTPRYGAALLAASAPGSRIASRSASPLGLRPVSSHVGLARLGAIRGPPSPFADDGYLEANTPAEDVPSRPSSAVYLPGLGDHALSVGDLARATAERVKPCAIHGEECDGVSVEGACLTEETKNGLGFVEEVPMIEIGGREMVDWAGLLQEARRE